MRQKACNGGSTPLSTSGCSTLPIAWQAMLASAGSQGWELAATMDKQFNWFDMEKGFLLMKRPVPAGVTPKQWCITVRG